MEQNRKKLYTVGIDIGGTNTVFGIVDEQGHILSHDGIKTKDYPDINVYADTVAGHLRSLIEAAGGIELINGIGVGAPNANYYTGQIEQAPNLPWKGTIPLARMLRERLTLPVTLTNDANAAALGEMTYGVAHGMKDFIMITLGTGVGSGIVLNGKLFEGNEGAGAELGHEVIRFGGEKCACGKRGCFEAYASATALIKQTKRAMEKDGQSKLWQLCESDINKVVCKYGTTTS